MTRKISNYFWRLIPRPKSPLFIGTWYGDQCDKLMILKSCGEQLAMEKWEKLTWQRRVNYVEIGGIICKYSNAFMNNSLQSKTPPAKFAFETIADPDHLEEIADFIENSLNELDVQDKYRGHICVAVDEAVTNVALYAYPNAKGNIRITIERIEDRVSVEIVDAGIAFNPLHHPVPDVTANIEKRLIGGLGVHLMRNMMDETHYRRIDDTNCLSFVKYIGGKHD